MYVIKLDGMKVRTFEDKNLAKVWAQKHCKSGIVEIVGLKDCGRLPKASDVHLKPSLNLNKGLVYKPFVAIC